MLATEHWRTDAVGDIVHQSASVMPRPECQRGAGRGVDPGWQEMEEGRWYSIIATWSPPFEPKGLWGFWETRCWHSEKAKSRGKESGDETLEISEEECQCCPPSNLHPWPPAHPSLRPCSHISICGSNEPASGPCGQSRSRPVIKMKWAVDPTVPFRRVEHWPRDLYLIDQPVQTEKSSFPPERSVPHTTALLSSKILCVEKKPREML